MKTLLVEADERKAEDWRARLKNNHGITDIETVRTSQEARIILSTRNHTFERVCASGALCTVPEARILLK